jgi:hypothetical protein
MVNTTSPELFTVPFANGAPSLVTVYRYPEVLPPIVHVIVWDVSLDVCVQAYSDPTDHAVKTEMVMRAVPSLFVTVSPETSRVPSRMVPITVRLLNVMP